MSNIIKHKRSTHIEQQITKKFLISLPIYKIKKLYENGMSINQLSKKFGVDRRSIRNRLVSVDTIIRTRSEAEKLKWSKMSGTKRAMQVSAAHTTRKGQTVS